MHNKKMKIKQQRNENNKQSQYPSNVCTFFLQ